MKRLLVPAIAAISLLVAAIGAPGCGERARPASAPVQPASARSKPAVAQPATAGLPDSAVGRQLGWVLERIATGDGRPTEAEIAEHFHSSFTAQIPAPQVIAIFGQLAAQLSPIRIASVDERPEGLIAQAETAAGKLRIQISVEAGGKIDALLFKPAEAPVADHASLEELGRAVEKLAPRASFLAAELAGGRCKPIHAVAADASLAIGSTTKLYVLLALADRILAGKLTWDSPLAIDDKLKSLPSGTMQDEPAGKKLSIGEFATKMISISDNTATDHLVAAVGRRRVEAAVKASGHAHPERNVPFMTTRELFLLKIGIPDADRDRYIAMKPAARRAYLDKTLAGKAPPQITEPWATPRQIDSLEWFASGDDLCRVMAGLLARSSKPAGKPLLGVLSANPGVPVDARVWPFVGFKGGSEPGVINATWLLRRDDDRWFVAVFTLNDPTAAIDDTKLIGSARRMFDLLAGHDRAKAAP